MQSSHRATSPTPASPRRSKRTSYVRAPAAILRNPWACSADAETAKRLTEKVGSEAGDLVVRMFQSIWRSPGVCKES